MVSIMKRTVRLATLPLNRGKYGELCSVIEDYTDAKPLDGAEHAKASGERKQKRCI